MKSELAKSAENILNFLGCEENILSVENCITRLRLKLVDNKIVDISEFKKIDGVLGVVETRDQLQIIMHPAKANDLINEFFNAYKIKK